MSKVERIQQDMMELSREERGRLMSALSFMDRRSETTLSRDEQHVLNVLSEVCETRIQTTKFLEQYGRRRFAERVEELLTFISDTRRYLRQVQVQSLVVTCLRCLASELRGREIPVTPRTVLNNMSMLRHAVDRRFPGYASAGLLHKVVGC